MKKTYQKLTVSVIDLGDADVLTNSSLLVEGRGDAREYSVNDFFANQKV